MKTHLIILFSLMSAPIFAQSEPTDLILPSHYTNWVSVDYLNCLKKQLPCQCEKSEELFLLDLDTSSRMYIHFYDGEANQDYGDGDLESFDVNSYYVFNYMTSEDYPNRIADTIGQFSIVGDTLSYIDSPRS